ncbi:TPA: hypothetical protein K7686_002220 [Salmonella enterica]|nr:hypothetical protein [Salmonella enterica subsp. enterica serovar Kentucky]HAF6029042.1 hypothetical protein [Salmonella enterica]HBI5212796.1 hypothetical protein [Salmonella enterica]HBI5272395.1 hypothetical protein [Salmonella enterica]HBI5290136.1 hypothetical protein [Salmonella enterica]
MGSNIIELAKLGHERTAELKASCGAVDVRSLAQLISDLASQLDVQLERCNQVQQQLDVAISERDAAVKAELVWEKSMMEACGEDGPASVAAEIAALRAQRDTALESLRQQLAAVVAENVVLKKAAEFATADDMWIEQADGMLDYRYCEWYVDVLKAAMETPATDACLAEVRASGADEVSAICRGLANKDGCSVNMQCSYNLTAERAEAVAAQLRKGTSL